MKSLRGEKKILEAKSNTIPPRRKILFWNHREQSESDRNEKELYECRHKLKWKSQKQCGTEILHGSERTWNGYKPRVRIKEELKKTI